MLESIVRKTLSTEYVSYFSRDWNFDLNYLHITQ